MNQKLLSFLMAVIMVLGVSMTAFADGEQTTRDVNSENTQLSRKVIAKASKTDTETSDETAEEDSAEKAPKASNKASVYTETIKRIYGSFDYPKNASAQRVDRMAYDIVLGEQDSEDAIYLRVRAFDHSTVLDEEIVDENGLLYGMYTGFLSIASLGKSTAEISRGINSQNIRREVVSMFNKVLLDTQIGKAVSYSNNDEMKAIQMTYSDGELAENCVILHGKDYDYVLFGTALDKNANALNKLTDVVAASLVEKTKG